MKPIYIILISLTLQSCMNAAVTGAQAVYSRHTLSSSFNDQYIAMKAERAIYIDTDRFRNTHVSISCFNGVILLTGQVENAEQRNEIAEIIRKLSDVKEIHNAIRISMPASTLTRMNDMWITTKIKSKLIAMNDIDPSQIKVITENGVVYLIGIVPSDQAEIAIDLARTTDGVQSVVKVFSYIHISKSPTMRIQS